MRIHRLTVVQLNILAIGLALLSSGCSSPPQESKPIVAFVAASTFAAEQVVAKAFEKETGVKVEITPGPSSGLAKQIQQGAAAQLFLSADRATMATLDAQKIVKQRDLLANRLVVIVPADSTLKISQLSDLALPEVKRIAVAEAKVPAGEYARQALAKAGVLAAVESRFVGGIDVKATMQYVARGEVEAGIVYRTDALGNSQVQRALEIPAELHDPIVYPLALLKAEPAHPAAERFYDFHDSPVAEAIFRRFEFSAAAK